MALSAPSLVKISALSLILISIISLRGINGRINRHKIEKRGSVDPFIQAIEGLAASISIDRYESDPILFQVVDSANSHSIYKDPQSDQVFYEREFVDRNKEIVVLSAEEDKIVSDGVKRQYIVLRATKLEGKPAKYYPSIAFLLNAEESTPGKISIAGKLYTVEWSVWHEGVLNGLKYSFNFHVCHYSAIIPCKVDPGKLGDGGKPTHSDDQSKGTTDKAVAKSDPTQATFPKSEYLEFFRDLDENKINGRVQIVGVAFDILSTAVDGIGSLWCGLSGLILGQCHQYDPGSNSYTKSQIGQAMTLANGTVLAGNAAMGNGILGTVINTVLPGNINYPAALMNGATPTEVTHGDGPVAGILGSITGLLGRKKRSDEPKARRTGWRTQYVKTIEPNVTYKAEGDVFYGLGNCPYVPGTTESFNKASTHEEVTTFYVNLLRNGCLSRVAKVIPALNSEEILEISGKSVKLVESSPILSQPKLTWVEEQKLCAAFEFHTLSKVYQEGRGSPETLSDPHHNPLDIHISKDVKFLVKFTLDFIREARNFGQHHYIRLLRHIVKLLRSVLEKLGEDARNLDACSGDCGADKELNLNDKLTIMGTIKYIMHGLPLEIRPKEELAPALKTFVSEHKAAIEIAVKEAKV